MLGSVALPLTNGFVGEFLLINGVYQFSPIAAAFAGLTVILGAVYMLRSYQQIMLGENKDSSFGVLARSEKLILVIICIVIIGLGVYPKPLNDIAEQASKDILINIK